MALGYRAGAVGGTTTNTSTSVSATIPTSGTGGTVIAGDVGIACITDSASVTVTSPPAGWTQRALTTNAQSNLTLAVFTKTLVSGDINTASTWVMSAAGEIDLTIDVLSGADETTFVYSTMAVGTGTTVTTPTITVPTSGFAFGFWAGATTSGAGFTFTKDASYTAASTRATSVASGANRTMGTAFITASGSTAGVGCTFSVSTARNAAFAIGIGPLLSVTMAGAVVDYNIAPLTGSFAAGTTLAGPTPPGLALAPLAGSVTAAVAVTASPAALAVAPLAGAVHAEVTIAGPSPPNMTLAALAGTIGTGVATTLSAAQATMVITPLAGTVTAGVSKTLTAAVIDLAIAPLAGSVKFGRTLSTAPPDLALTALAGTVFGATSYVAHGEVARLDITALTGVAGTPRDLTITLGALLRTWSASDPHSAWSASSPNVNGITSGEIGR